MNNLREIILKIISFMISWAHKIEIFFSLRVMVSYILFTFVYN